MKTTIGFFLKAGFALAGLVVLVSLFATAVFLLLVWLLRAIWSRLTGQPVRPWMFSMNQQDFLRRFNRAPQEQHKAYVHDSNVIDVEPKEVKSQRL